MGSYALVWAEIMQPEQWVELCKWVPLGLLLAFGGLETVKLVMPHMRRKK